jgi:hypothetical protein
VADMRESERQTWGLGWGRVSEAGEAAIAHEGEGVLLLGRRHECCAWFGLTCRRVEIEDEERGATRATVASWGVDVFAATSEARSPSKPTRCLFFFNFNF